VTPDQIASIVEARLICGEPDNDPDITHGFASDLMSDVLTLTQEHVLFITGLVAPQTIRTAAISDIGTILFVRGKSVPQSIVALAKENDITVLTTAYSMYRACGELYSAGLNAVY
jgi:predicted transcriptional regulator